MSRSAPPCILTSAARELALAALGARRGYAVEQRGRQSTTDGERVRTQRHENTEGGLLADTIAL